MSDCLRVELKPFGIDVIIVEPGGIKTNWGAIAADNLKKTAAGGAYEEYADKAAGVMVGLYSGNMPTKPEVIAKTIRKAVTKKRPKTRYLTGFLAKPLVLVRRIFGDRFYDFLLNIFE